MDSNSSKNRPRRSAWELLKRSMLVALALFVALAVGGGLWVHSETIAVIHVRVSNESSAKIDSVRFFDDGGIVELKNIAPGDSFTVRAQPRTEFSFCFEWEQAGATHDGIAHEYPSWGERSRVHVQIQDGGVYTASMPEDR